MDKSAVRSKLVVLLLLTHCLLLLHFRGFCVWTLFCYAELSVRSLAKGINDDCLTLIVFLLPCDCYLVFLPHDVVGWSVHRFTVSFAGPTCLL